MHIVGFCDMIAAALPVAAVSPSFREGSFALRFSKGGLPMVTYSDLIQVGILIVGILGLFMQAKKK